MKKTLRIVGQLGFENMHGGDGDIIPGHDLFFMMPHAVFYGFAFPTLCETVELHREAHSALNQTHDCVDFFEENEKPSFDKAAIKLASARLNQRKYGSAALKSDDLNAVDICAEYVENKFTEKFGELEAERIKLKADMAFNNYFANQHEQSALVARPELA